MEERSYAVLVRLTEKQKKKLLDNSTACGMKMEPFIRKLIEGVEIRAKPTENYLNLIREINAIGNNINQIAHIANAQKYADKEQIGYIVKCLDDIMDKVRELE